PEAAIETVRARTGGHGVDLVLETVGGDSSILDQAWPMLRRRGRTAALGLFGKDVRHDLSIPHGKEATLLFPVCYGEQDGRHDYEVTIDLMASGKANVAHLL